MVFLKEEILKSLQQSQEPDWAEEESAQMIQLYEENPCPMEPSPTGIS